MPGRLETMISYFLRHFLRRSLALSTCVFIVTLVGCDTAAPDTASETAGLVSASESVEVVQYAREVSASDADVVRTHVLSQAEAGALVVLGSEEAALFGYAPKGIRATKKSCAEPGFVFYNILNITDRAERYGSRGLYESCQQVLVETIPSNPDFVVAQLYAENDFSYALAENTYRQAEGPLPVGTSTIGCRTRFTFTNGTARVVEERFEAFGDAEGELPELFIIGRRETATNTSFVRDCRHRFEVDGEQVQLLTRISEAILPS